MATSVIGRNYHKKTDICRKSVKMSKILSNDKVEFKFIPKIENGFGFLYKKNS